MRPRPLQLGTVGWVWWLGWAATAVAAGSNEPVSISPTWESSMPSGAGAHTDRLRFGFAADATGAVGLSSDKPDSFLRALRGAGVIGTLALDTAGDETSPQTPLVPEYGSSSSAAFPSPSPASQLPADLLAPMSPPGTGPDGDPSRLTDPEAPQRARQTPRLLRPMRSRRDAPATMPVRRLPGGGSWGLSTVAALGAVLGLIFLLRWGLNRLSGRVSAASHSAMLEVLGRVKVAPRSNVLLIRLGHRLLIVSESTAGLSTLANIDDPEEVATLLRASSVARPHGATSAFSSLLRRFSIEHRNADRIATEGNDSDEYHVDRARDQVSGLLARVRNTISSGGPR